MSNPLPVSSILASFSESDVTALLTLILGTLAVLVVVAVVIRWFQNRSENEAYRISVEKRAIPDYYDADVAIIIGKAPNAARQAALDYNDGYIRGHRIFIVPTRRNQVAQLKLLAWDMAEKHGIRRDCFIVLEKHAGLKKNAAQIAREMITTNPRLGRAFVYADEKIARKAYKNFARVFEPHPVSLRCRVIAVTEAERRRYRIGGHPFWKAIEKARCIRAKYEENMATETQLARAMHVVDMLFQGPHQTLVGY